MLAAAIMNSARLTIGHEIVYTCSIHSKGSTVHLMEREDGATIELLQEGKRTIGSALTQKTAKEIVDEITRQDKFAVFVPHNEEEQLNLF